MTAERMAHRGKIKEGFTEQLAAHEGVGELPVGLRAARDQLREGQVVHGGDDLVRLTPDALEVSAEARGGGMGEIDVAHREADADAVHPAGGDVEGLFLDVG